MALAFVLPTGYPWVLAAASGLTFVNIYQILLVSAARKRSGIKYPQLYATKEQEESSNEAKIFNCTQRAHQNTLENAHIFLFSTLVSGLGFPRLTVGLAATHLIARVVYTLGYSTGDPKKRSAGAGPSSFALLALVGTSTWTIFKLLSDSTFQI